MIEKNIKPIIILIVTIILCSILARTFSGNETLAEYASKHPEIAYGENKSEAESITSEDPALSENNSSK